MPSRARDLAVYRRDERMGHQLLTREERMKLIESYLPSPPSRSRSSSQTRLTRSATRQDKMTRFGVRRFLRRQYHVLVFVLIHIFFSLYIRLRQAYHAVGNRVYSVYYHHHRTPALIRRDLKGLGRLPKHLSVILTLEDQRRGGGDVEKLVDEVSEIAAWCASAGIFQLSIYEKTGVLKSLLKATHRAISQKLCFYFGPDHPSVSLGAPHLPPVGPSVVLNGSGHGGGSSSGDDDDHEASKHLSVLLISAEDGRESIVDLTKTLAEMSQRKKLSTADITMELVDAELNESIMSEPDLLILFGPHVELAGYPPWQIRLTEIFHVRDNQEVDYQVFLRGLRKYAQAQMRLGR